MKTQTANNEHPFPVSAATVPSVTIALLAYGARGNWTDTTEIIEGIHRTDDDMLARVMTAMYQTVENMPGEATARQRIARSTTYLNLDGYSAMRVAYAMLDRLTAGDVPGFADAWDGVRYAFGGRNVAPVAASVLMIILGALEAEDNNAHMLLDRLTSDGAFVEVLRQFGFGDDTAAGADCD